MREFDAPQHLVVAGVWEGLAREMGEAAEIMIAGESRKLERDRVVPIERVGREQLFQPVGRLGPAYDVADRREEGDIEAPGQLRDPRALRGDHWVHVPRRIFAEDVKMDEAFFSR